MPHFLYLLGKTHTFPSHEEAIAHLDAISPRPVYYSIIDEAGKALEGSNDPILGKRAVEDPEELELEEVETL